MDNSPVKVLITWYKDPSQIPVNEWIRDIVVHFGEIKDKQLHGDTWTVLVRITEQVDGTWDSYAEAAFIVDESPWELLVPGFSFNLWAGKDIAKVTVI